MPKRLQLSLLAALLLTACAPQRPQPQSPVETLTALGRKLFYDPALSRSGKMSCATCHDPHYAFGPPPGLPMPGPRAIPSLRYLQTDPPFTEHYYSSDRGDDSIDNGPTGGLDWDGRIDRARDQARIPLLSPAEMANASPAELTARLKGPDFNTILEALETYLQDYRDFYPYSSKYDAWLAGRAQLTPQESRGLRLFKDPTKGNCANCHIADRSATGAAPQFTDYGLIAIGPPRNPNLTGFVDLGLCGPLRTDFTTRADYCGRFLTPTLRNVATRTTFFHNGAITSLKDAVTFYVQRDAQPEKWRGDAANLNHEPPFSKKPALTDPEIDDIVAFLGTLTDQDIKPR
jgi:cytochrome c peroxidase